MKIGLIFVILRIGLQLVTNSFLHSCCLFVSWLSRVSRTSVGNVFRYTFVHSGVFKLTSGTMTKITEEQSYDENGGLECIS